MFRFYDEREGRRSQSWVHVQEVVVEIIEPPRFIEVVTTLAVGGFEARGLKSIFRRVGAKSGCFRSFYNPN